MTDMVKLKKAIDDSGMTMTAIAKKGVCRQKYDCKNRKR